MADNNVTQWTDTSRVETADLQRWEDGANKANCLEKQIPELIAAHNTADGTHEDIRALANKKANSLVFDTKEQLDSWVAGTYSRPDGKTTSDLKVGDNLYIVELGVPDYWWNGATIVPIEVETDQSYDPNSSKAQSGKAVAEALGTLKKKFELIDSLIVGYSLLTSKPDDWESNFYNYYEVSKNGFNNIQSSSIGYPVGVYISNPPSKSFYSTIINLDYDTNKITLKDDIEVKVDDTIENRFEIGNVVYYYDNNDMGMGCWLVKREIPEWESNKYYSKTDEISQINRYYDTKYSSVRVKVQFPDSVATTRMIIDVIGRRDNNKSGSAGYILSEQGYRYLDYAVNIANGGTDNGILYEHTKTPNSSPAKILSGSDTSLVQNTYDLITDWIGIYFIRISMYDGSTIPTGTKIYLYGVKANED